MFRLYQAEAGELNVVSHTPPPKQVQLLQVFNTYAVAVAQEVERAVPLIVRLAVLSVYECVFEHLGSVNKYICRNVCEW